MKFIITFIRSITFAIVLSAAQSCGSGEHTSQMDNSRNDSTAIDSSNSGNNKTVDIIRHPD